MGTEKLILFFEFLLILFLVGIIAYIPYMIYTDIKEGKRNKITVTEVCIDHVTYIKVNNYDLSSVKFNNDGKIVTCKG